MGKKKGRASAKETGAKPKSRASLIAGVLLIVAALGIGGHWWTSGGGAGPVRGAKPAIPRVPRPATLSPALFTGHAAKGYQVAKEIPEVLEHIMCYCGCDRTPGHQNTLDCFADDHGAGCNVCVDIALEAQRLYKQGLQVAEIKNRIDRTFAQ